MALGDGGGYASDEGEVVDDAGVERVGVAAQKRCELDGLRRWGWESEGELLPPCSPLYTALMTNQ